MPTLSLSLHFHAQNAALLVVCSGVLAACDLEEDATPTDDGGIGGGGGATVPAGADCGAPPAEAPIGPLTGRACDAAVDGCSADPMHDPWSYACTDEVLAVVYHLADESCLCFASPDGTVVTGCRERLIAEGGCFPQEEAPPVGESTGKACAVEGATECAADVSRDPYFYVCRGGRLEVTHHELFHGAVRCLKRESGEIRPEFTR